MRGNKAGHIRREGLHTGKSYGKMVPRAGERHQETREKIKKGQVASVGRAATVRGNAGAGLLSASGSECATGMMTSKDFLSGVFFIHRPRYWGPLCCFWLSRFLPALGLSKHSGETLIKSRDVSPSLDMPTDRHFLKRQCWHRLRFMRMMRQFSFFTHIL